MATKIRVGKWFTEGLLPKKIEGFDYLQKFCRYCERELILESAIHIDDEPWLFKALYVCDNERCPAMDQPPHKPYVKVYYSDKDAFDRLQLARTFYQRSEKDVEKVYYT